MDAEASSTGTTARSYNASEIYRTLRTAIRCVGWVGIAYLFFDTAREFAGKSTELNLALSLLLNAIVSLKVLALFSLTGLATAWAMVERALKHRTVAEMQGRITELEKMIDPSRSSSRLTASGRTNPSDLRG